VSGWGPSQYRIQARDSLAEQDFDLMLEVIYLGNDAEGRMVESFPPRPFVKDSHLRLPTSLAWSEIVDALLYPVNDFLERRSHLFVFLKNNQTALLMKLGLSARYVPQEMFPSEWITEAWSTTAKTIRDTVRMADRRGIPSVVVIVPSHYQVVPEALEIYSEGFDFDTSGLDPLLPDKTLEGFLSREGVEYIDTFSALEHAFGEGEVVYGAVDTHLNARGHEVVLEAVLPEILRRLGEPREPAP